MKTRLSSKSSNNSNIPYMTLTRKSKKSRQKSTFKTPLSKTSRLFLSSHLKPQRKKSSSSQRTSRMTEENTTLKRETQTWISTWEWSPKVCNKYNKSECHSNNKLWWKLVSLNTTSLSINTSWVPFCKNKWWFKELAQSPARSCHWMKSRKLSTCKLITCKNTVKKSLKN